MNFFSHVRRRSSVFVPLLILFTAGCFRSVSPKVDQIKCQTDLNCPVNYQCVKAAGEPTGKCVLATTRTDGGIPTDATSGDAKIATTPTDALVSEVARPVDTLAADTLMVPGTDAKASPDTTAPVTTTDALDKTDTTLAVDIGKPNDNRDTGVPPSVDAPVDAPVDTAKDTAPPCNGGCCTSAECPLTAPVCNSANKCVGCAGDPDCSGRSASACNTTSGACVQCTRNSQCGGATATCNTATNLCVGCTQRSDCPGACQTCTGGSCVAVKNADDPSKCPGTCDATGECKAKQGQTCASVASGCVAGTTCSPDGVCCNRACGGSCEACDLPASLGTCTVLPSGGTPHTGHAACTGTGTCAGTCTGASNGACAFPTSACGSATCTGTSSQAAGTCSQGTCSLPAPVSCKTGASCSGNACACPLGTSDCGTACANLDSDPKNCGACGHDCLGGPCQGGICQPYKLGDVPTGYSGWLIPDGGRVYAVTQQTHRLDTSKVWVTDATTPGTPVKVPPDNENSPTCVIDGTIFWHATSDGNGEFTYQYCSASGCAASTRTVTQSLTKPSEGYFSMATYPECDAANKQVIWAIRFTPDSGADSTVTIYRSSITGTAIQTVTSFPLLAGATEGYTNGFAVGRTDRYFFTRTTGTTVRVYMVSTTASNATPVLLATGAVASPVDITYARLYANDSLLAWSSGSTSYRMPLPNGVGTSTPPTFSGGIDSGIMDNHHFYGMIQSLPFFSWCSVPSCSARVLTSTSLANAFAQDTGAIYWCVMNDTADGFGIWKVAKQPY
jgi:hypothetical protein